MGLTRFIVADYDSAAKVAAANADELCEALAGINVGEEVIHSNFTLTPSSISAPGCTITTSPSDSPSMTCADSPV